jgi:hypothetical protein
MRRWGYVTLDGAGRGGGVVDHLREGLTSIGERFPGLPDTLPILRYGLFCEVEDTAGRSAGESSLGALLSRPLLAFALGYERGVKLSLAVMLNVVRVLVGDGVRVTDLPGLSGVSREAIAMALTLLETAQCVEVWSRDRRRVVRLTDRGPNARRRGLRRVRDQEAAWHERFGDELRAALAPLVGDGTRSGSRLFAGLEPYPRGWRSDVRPPGRLPWFPMVPHRGGWPDGS